MWKVIYTYFYNWDRSHDLVLIVYTLVELIIKTHIRLRTISLLISTHNTQVYIQWMSYSFVWLYLIKYVFTCSIFFYSNTKIFLSVLGVFGKYFVFTKKKKKNENFKNGVALFWRLIRGSTKSHAIAASSRVGFGDLFANERSNREGYIEIFTAQLATPSWVDLPIAKNA